ETADLRSSVVRTANAPEGWLEGSRPAGLSCRSGGPGRPPRTWWGSLVERARVGRGLGGRLEAQSAVQPRQVTGCSNDDASAEEGRGLRTIRGHVASEVEAPGERARADPCTRAGEDLRPCAVITRRLAVDQRARGRARRSDECAKESGYESCGFAANEVGPEELAGRPCSNVEQRRGSREFDRVRFSRRRRLGHDERTAE